MSADNEESAPDLTTGNPLPHSSYPILVQLQEILQEIDVETLKTHTLERIYGVKEQLLGVGRLTAELLGKVDSSIDYRKAQVSVLRTHQWS